VSRGVDRVYVVEHPHGASIAEVGIRQYIRKRY
jgi:hypothetical protein